MTMDLPTLLRHLAVEAGNRGVLIMLDLHSMAPGKWPDDGRVGTTGRDELIRAWGLLAEYLCDPVTYWNVFAADLKNEPHGMHWGRGPAEQRWDIVAAAIGEQVHAQCPRWLLVVEGVGHCMSKEWSDCGGCFPCPTASVAGQDMAIPTWWGENLQAAMTFPVTLSDAANKVVYSPHAYVRCNSHPF
mmetsp:Transcript_43460/g.98221  ORF Transcript_43460/g.98221 Transcript_43460/m.98221 type:complete len:187 (+) Transcript_43460:1-561(+)